MRRRVELLADVAYPPSAGSSAGTKVEDGVSPALPAPDHQPLFSATAFSSPSSVIS